MRGKHDTIIFSLLSPETERKTCYMPLSQELGCILKLPQFFFSLVLQIYTLCRVILMEVSHHLDG